MIMEELVCPIPAISELTSEENCSLQVHNTARRNSVSSIFGIALNHGRSAGRASVPSISAADREKLKQVSNGYKAASNLQASQSLKSRFKRYQYIRSSSESIEQSGVLSKLDETFAQIKSQLNSLSEENRTVRTRVHSLTEAVTELCSHFSTRGDEEDEEDEDIDGEDNFSLSLSLPSNGIQRMHSVPPFSTGWRDIEVFDDDIMDTNTMSNDDWERINWVKSLERSGETNLIGLHNARVPCIIMVDDCNDSTSEDENEDQDIDGDNERHEDTASIEYNECDRTNEDDYKYEGFDIIT